MHRALPVVSDDGGSTAMNRDPIRLIDDPNTPMQLLADLIAYAREVPFDVEAGLARLQGTITKEGKPGCVHGPPTAKDPRHLGWCARSQGWRRSGSTKGAERR